MRIEQLTFTRFIAASLIVIFHYGVDIFPFSLQKTVFLGANIGVSYFFVLSGFVMIVAYHKKQKISIFDYLRNRFARIYPLYLLATLILVSYYLLSTNVSIDLIDLFANLFMIQSWMPQRVLTLNFPGWSLSVELFFYITFPILFNYFYNRLDYKKLALPILLFFGVSQLVFFYFFYSEYYQGPNTVSHDLLFYFPVIHLNEFLVGNLLGLYFIQRDYKTRNNAFLIISLIIVCALILAYGNAIDYHNGILAVIFAPMILLISYDHSWISRISRSKSLIHLGEISYGVYILQIPVFSITRRLLIYLGITNKASIFYICFIVLILFSSITYKFIETPLRKKIKSIKLAS
ncbi:acyltransferase family protein [Pseudotenacibaculum haliotis]|uniref:Acyltransferase family protein n=1 Tax=Pseudotenacibaculum haliotis TaxID=1862138 RepID=A0ABW5LSI4_9FLAO